MPARPQRSKRTCVYGSAAPSAKGYPQLLPTRPSINLHLLELPRSDSKLQKGPTISSLSLKTRWFLEARGSTLVRRVYLPAARYAMFLGISGHVVRWTLRTHDERMVQQPAARQALFYDPTGLVRDGKKWMVTCLNEPLLDLPGPPNRSIDFPPNRWAPPTVSAVGPVGLDGRDG